MGNAVVEDNYQISLNYMSPAVMDRLLWLNYRGRKKTWWARFHRHTQCFLFTLLFAIHIVLFPFTSNADWLMRLPLRLDCLTPCLNMSSGQLVIFDRVTECEGRGGSEFAPAEPWSLAGQGDRTPVRCHRRVCVRVCAYRARLPWRQHPDRGDLVCGFVGGWLGALAMFEYFCIFVICTAHAITTCP